MIKKYSVLLIIMGIVLTLSLLNVRICPFFHFFKIPCVGCGMTRSIMLILSGKIFESFRYNILVIPLIFLVLTYVVWDIINPITQKQFIRKHQRSIIIIASIMMLVTWFININNPLLY